MEVSDHEFEGEGEDDLYDSDGKSPVAALSRASSISSSNTNTNTNTHTHTTSQHPSARTHAHGQAIAQMKQSLSHLGLGEGTQTRRPSASAGGMASASPVGPSFDDLMAELSDLYTKLEAKDKDLVMAGEMGSMLLEKNEEANVRVEELTEQVEQLQEEADKLRNVVRGEERKNQRLHKQVEEHEHQKKELADAVEGLRAELAAEREKGKGRKDIQAKSEELSDELSGRIRELESKLARQVSEFQKLSKEHAATLEAIDELKDNLTDAQQEIAKGKKLAVSYQQAVTEIEKLKADNKTNQLSALQFENSHLTDTVMGLTQELQKYQQVYEENKHLYQVAQQKIEQLTNDNASLKKKLSLRAPSPAGPRKSSFISLADDLEEDDVPASKPTTPKSPEPTTITLPLPAQPTTTLTPQPEPKPAPVTTPAVVTAPAAAAAAVTPVQPSPAPSPSPSPSRSRARGDTVTPPADLPASSPNSIITSVLQSSPSRGAESASSSAGRLSVVDAFVASSPIEASIFEQGPSSPAAAPARVSSMDTPQSMNKQREREAAQKRQLESSLNNPLTSAPNTPYQPPQPTQQQQQQQQQARPAFVPTYTIASPPPAIIQQQQIQAAAAAASVSTPQTTPRSGWLSSITSRITGRTQTPATPVTPVPAASAQSPYKHLQSTNVGYGASPLHVMPGDPDYIPPVSGLHEYGRGVKPATDERALWEFFSLSVLSIKLNAGAGKDVELLYSINAKELWEKAKKDNLQFHQYHDWLKIEINKAYYHKLYKQSGASAPAAHTGSPGYGYVPPVARPTVAGIPAAYQHRVAPPLSSAAIFGRTSAPAPAPAAPTPASSAPSTHGHANPNPNTNSAQFGSTTSMNASPSPSPSPQPGTRSTGKQSASPGLSASSHGAYSNQASLNQSLLDRADHDDEDDEAAISARLQVLPTDDTHKTR